MNEIKKRPLGNTGLELTELGLGGVYLSPKKIGDPKKKISV
ncbi:MAG: aryl-alcohol dehydrogenase-like predicted oxidoreductase [Candidatus Latescibacterota bacterium]|jgi:aryl-alcohol dehydrogenase-like predicted oxidoreductase